MFNSSKWLHPTLLCPTCSLAPLPCRLGTFVYHIYRAKVPSGGARDVAPYMGLRSRPDHVSMPFGFPLKFSITMPTWKRRSIEDQGIAKISKPKQKNDHSKDSFIPSSSYEAGRGKRSQQNICIFQTRVGDQIGYPSSDKTRTLGSMSDSPVVGETI